MKPSFIALVLTLCHGVAHGGLKWDRHRVELSPGPTDTFVDATFGFANAGPAPVTITKLESSCGCTKVAVPKMTIEAGERSELAARFDITGRRGIQSKTVTVHIEGEKDPVVLTLVVSIPDLVKIIPPLVVWGKGEDAKPKTILLQAMEGHAVNIANVSSSQARLTAKLETIREGQQYAIVVTPDDTATVSFAVLTIESEYQGQKKNLRAFAQVKEGR